MDLDDVAYNEPSHQDLGCLQIQIFLSLVDKELNRQSGSQDQKSVIFLQNVISLNQLLQNSKNTANIFLTFRNLAKYFSLRIFCMIFKMLSTVKI